MPPSLATLDSERVGKLSPPPFSSDTSPEEMIALGIGGTQKNDEATGNGAGKEISYEIDYQNQSKSFSFVLAHLYCIHTINMSSLQALDRDSRLRERLARAGIQFLILKFMICYIFNSTNRRAKVKKSFNI